MNHLEVERLQNSIRMGEQQVSGMEQHLGRLAAEVRTYTDRIAAAKAALEALRGRLRVIAAGHTNA